MIAEVTIEKIVRGGEGIGRIGKVVVFVPYSAPGDRLRVNVVAQKRNYWSGRIAEIIAASPLRIAPPCPYYGTCGGCNLQHLNCDAQLAAKKLLVSECLQKIGKVLVPPGDLLATGAQWHYRNKTQYPVGSSAFDERRVTNDERRFLVGFFESRSHRIVDVERCLIQPDEFDAIRAELLPRLATSSETAYDETTGKGNLRHLVLKKGAATGELALMFVTATERLDPSLHEGLLPTAGTPNTQHPTPNTHLVSLAHNINPEQTNRVMGDSYRELAGQAYYSERLLDWTLRISSGSFFQANTGATELLVRQVIKCLTPDDRMTVLDLYSGVGTFTVPIAAVAGKVIAIESDPHAAADARTNIDINGVQNVEVIEATVEQGIQRIAQADSIVLDPPRKGCPPEVLKAMAELKPREIVYVSCNPATLARDLAGLRELGYDTTAVQPVDMFPQTAHVEVVAKLVPSVPSVLSVPSS